MEITKALQTDHDKLKSLLSTIVDGEDAKEIKTAFGAFADLLARHSKAEEKVVYEALTGTCKEKVELTAHEGYTEHMLADTLLAKLKDGTSPKSIEWRAEAQVMQEILTHHIREEEGKIFDDVKSNFNHEVREEMGDAFEREKEKVEV